MSVQSFWDYQQQNKSVFKTEDHTTMHLLTDKICRAARHLGDNFQTLFQPQLGKKTQNILWVHTIENKFSSKVCLRTDYNTETSVTLLWNMYWLVLPGDFHQDRSTHGKSTVMAQVGCVTDLPPISADLCISLFSLLWQSSQRNCVKPTACNTAQTGNSSGRRRDSETIFLQAYASIINNK